MNSVIPVPANNSNIDPADNPDWETGQFKPTLIRFKGAERMVHPLDSKPTTPLEYFKLLFDDDLVDGLIYCKNVKGAILFKHIRKKLPQKPPRKKCPKKWKLVCQEEFLKFLGLCMFMGNIGMPTVKHYWRSNASMYRHPTFGETMARNGFENILLAIRFYDPMDKTK